MLERVRQLMARLNSNALEPVTVPRSRRVVIAGAFGGWGAFITYFSLVVAPHHLAKDFSWPWRGARALLAGLDPYAVIRATGDYPFNVGLFYPLTAVVAAVPFAPLPPHLAGTFFIGISSALLAYGLSRNRNGLVKLPLFVSAPFCMAAVLGQWAPLMVAVATLPALQFLAATKPNIGFVTWLYRPTVSGALLGVLFVLVTVVLLPSWPAAWREALQATPRYRGPLVRGVSGAILLVAVLWWRRREGRLFLAMAAVPQLSLFYDQLPLWLIPSTVGRSFLLSALSWVAWSRWYPYRASTSSVPAAEPWVFWLLYVPALILLMLLPRAESARSSGAADAGASEPHAPIA
jgi:hypothetical protein